MIVRLATPADGPTLARVQLETWRTAYRGLISDAALNTHTVPERERFWSERFRQPKGSVFAAEEGSIIGFCELIPSEDKDADPKAFGELAELYVLPEHWRKGAGRALCDRALAEARRQEYRTVTLWALEMFGPARDFYQAMGFREDGCTKMITLPDGSELHLIRLRVCV
ncbi:MAG TPA: GNAT family N-acetyltransferase [Candidatus Acidoferrum sp.]|nr:GNAT family N-acetyltransferase [Candidatus Acidoferrum sp.]